MSWVEPALGGIGLLGSLFGGGAEVSPELAAALRSLKNAANGEFARANTPLGALAGEQLQMGDLLGSLGNQQHDALKQLFAHLTAADTPHLADLKANVQGRNIAQQMAARSSLLGQFAQNREGYRQQGNALLGQAAGVAGQFPGTQGAGQSFGQLLGLLGQRYGMAHGLGRSPEAGNALVAAPKPQAAQDPNAWMWGGGY